MLRVLGISVFACCVSTIAASQSTDCAAIARDALVKKEFVQRSDYAKLQFMSRLVQMDEQTAKETLDHVGRVEWGPLKIGPGSWSKQKQNELKNNLDKYVSTDQLNSSALSMVLSSGDDVVAKVVSDCIDRQGGLKLAVKPAGKLAATINVSWAPYPGNSFPAIVEEVTILNGKVTGGVKYTKSGFKLGDRLDRIMTVSRIGDKDLIVVVNTTLGAAQGYLPPSIVPPPQPAQLVRKAIDSDEKVSEYSGTRGKKDCERKYTAESCVAPRNGGKLVVGMGVPKYEEASGVPGLNFSHEVTQNTPERFCVRFWAATGACEIRLTVTGRASSIEEYPETD